MGKNSVWLPSPRLVLPADAVEVGPHSARAVVVGATQAKVHTPPNVLIL